MHIIPGIAIATNCKRLERKGGEMKTQERKRERERERERENM